MTQGEARGVAGDMDLFNFPYALAPFPEDEAARVPPVGRPISALLLATDPSGRPICHLRDDRPGLVFGGCWHLFGGSIEPGETPRDAALRECAEEIGVALGPSDVAPFASVDSPPEANRRLWIFRALEPISLAQISLGEGAGFGALTADQIERYPFVPYARLALRAHLADAAH